jgi:DNA-binding NarL/FixJ family response regulator
MNQITILFADKHPLIRKAWDFLLRQNARLNVVAACESGETAVELSKKLNPDIAIIDTCLRGMNGLEATQLIIRNSPSAKVIGLSFYTQTEIAYKILLSGAMGCLSKSSYPEEIFKTIIEVLNGRTYICREMQAVHPVDALIDRISPHGFGGKKIITVNKPRLQECVL